MIFDQNSPERICEEDALGFLLAVFGLCRAQLARHVTVFRQLPQPFRAWRQAWNSPV